MEKVNFIKSSFLLLPDAIGSTITGVGGSIVRDTFLKEIPVVLKEEFYATCCIIGSIFL